LPSRALPPRRRWPKRSRRSPSGSCASRAAERRVGRIGSPAWPKRS
jgi:hypothetical protein